MLTVNHPGPWHLFVNRPDNKGLHILEIKQKYLHEQVTHENQLFQTVHIQNMLSIQPKGGGSAAGDNTVNEFNFDITANWNLTTPAVVDEKSFRTFLESGEDGDGGQNNLIDVVITDFSLVGNRLTCNVFGNGNFLTLAHLEITNVNAIGNIIGITQIDLYSNQIVIFDPLIALPNGLEELYLNDNQIVTFNPSLSLPNSIINLDLSENQIVTFNPTISLPSSLISLSLINNQIVTFNPTIALPNSLQNLELFSNQIVTLDSLIAVLPSGLTLLDLGSNQIVTFDPTIALPSGLETLYLDSNPIVTFNPTIALPNSLQELFLGDNQMTTAGYTNSEPWANAMSVIPGRGDMYFDGNVNSITGTDLETILIAKGWTVNP